MQQRVKYLFRIWLRTMLLFMAAKIVFMLCYAGSESFSVGDVFAVVIHGLSLDFSTSLYILALPFLLTIAAVWMRVNEMVMNIYFLLISFALALAFVADTSLYAFWHFKLDASCLPYLATPTEAMASVSVGYLLLRLLLVIVLTVIIFLCYIVNIGQFHDVRFRPKPLPHDPSIRYQLNPKRGINVPRPLETIIYILLIPLYVIGIRGGISESTTNIGQAYFSQNPFLNHSAVNPVFSFFASFERSANHLPDYHFMDDDEALRIVGEYYNTQSISPDTLLRTKRPNVIVVLMESCGGIFTALEGRSDVMPRLNKLMDEGICFDSCYANSWRTDRGTVCTYSGYPSFPISSVMKMPSKTRFLPGMARTLADEGYSTHYLYGGDINFTNMRSYLISTGFETLTWKKDYTKEEQLSSEWGVHDHITFKTLETLAHDYSAEGKPFFIGYSTLSSHQPWTVPVAQFDDEVLNAFYYLDQCIGQFVDSLRQTPLWDNLLVVLLPDHAIDYGGVGEYDRRHNHIPMVWVGGAVAQPRHLKQVCNQTDLAATLFGQMDISHDDFCYSRDVLSRSYQRPIAVHTFNNAISVIDSTGFAVYDLDTRKITVGDTPDAQRLISVGQAVLQRAAYDLNQMK